jgi:hypothetical protein
MPSADTRPEWSLPPITPDPVIDAYKPGIDRTLLRENLRRSVEERVRNFLGLQRAAAELRRAGRAARRDP